MNANTTISIGLICTLLGAIITYIVFWNNQKNKVKVETKEETERNVRLEVKLDTISSNVNEIRLENKDFSKSLNQLSERVGKVEESAKSAHKRIDKIEEKEV